MSLEHLNPSQKEAVLQTQGPLMILAGAGSGKTRTLVSRIEYLLYEKKISPYYLLAVTFSNKAAKEMRERIARGSDFDFGSLQITTFHSFCARVLRSEANYLGLSRSFTIYDTSESKSIIKSILSRRGISLKEVSPAQVQYFIDDIKNSGHYVDSSDDEVLAELDTDDEFFEYYLEYEKELHKSNAVDFGGLITGVISLFERFPEVKERYQKRFKYILVDEYQDTNRAQFKLIKLLSQQHRNICVVGDEDQSIYSWRGADIRNILEFEQVFPESQVIKLEQNYRSTQNIIEAAGHVIARNEQRKGKNMWTDNDQGESIQIIECLDDKLEAKFVAQEIHKIINSGVSPSEIAVFYRTNAQSRILEDALRLQRLAYRVVAGIKFYERKEIKDLLAYMRVVTNTKDSLALIRVINTPTRGIGTTTLRKIENEAVSKQLSLWEVVQDIVDNSENYSHIRISSKVKSSLRQFVDLINEVKVMESEQDRPSLSYQKLLNDSGYLEVLNNEKTYESQARIENLEELLSAITQFEETRESASMTTFLEDITLDSNVDDSTDEDREVSLMTIHGSKGLEYTHVFVTGVEESVFPSYMSIESGEYAIEEERRLFYVAMTRAMRKLYISFAQGRMLWGSLKFNGPSRFLDEIPEQYYTWTSLGGKSGVQSVGRKNNDQFDYSDEFSQDNFYNQEVVYSTQSSSSPKEKSKFTKGNKVNHKLYGNGVIMNSDGYGQDEKVVIQFDDGTKKKFMVKFAPISHT